MEGIVQIAGIRSPQEAEMILEAGVDWLGFPLKLDVHPEDLTAETVAAIVSSLGIRDRTVLITYLENASEIAGLAAYVGCRRVQLHGDITSGETHRLKISKPGLYLIKALVVRPGNLDDLADTAREFGPHVDAFITDTWDPQSGARGATGKTHDWNASRQIVVATPKPVILAGGLTPENVRRAIIQVGPAGVDAHTGVEALDGMKDPALVRAFVEEARRAFAVLRREDIRS